MAALMLGIDFGKTDIQIGLWNEEKTCAEMYSLSEPKEAVEAGPEGITNHLRERLDSIRNRYGGASIAKIGITGERMNAERQEQLTKQLTALGYEAEQLYFSTHADAVLWYELCTGSGKSSSMTLDFDDSGMMSYLVIPGDEAGERPFRVETTDYSTIAEAGVECIRDEEERQTSFERITELAISRKDIARLYVTGSFIDAPEITQVLGRLTGKERRIFTGQGLYCLGVCYHAVKEKFPKNVIGDGCIFHNVSLDAYKDSVEGPVLLLKAGTKLETACARMQVIPDDTMDLSFQIGDVRTGEAFSCIMRPEGFHYMENKTLRLEVELYFLEYETMVIKLRDVGFGEICPATYRVWEQIVSLS